MEIILWSAIALVSFVLPPVSETGGGRREPDPDWLQRHAETIGLDLPSHLIGTVATRIRRKHRGMAVGGVLGILTAFVTLLLIKEPGWTGILTLVLTGLGAALGAAVAVVAHHQGRHPLEPVVTRTRSVGLADYLTRGERVATWSAPVALAVGALVGTMLILQLPENEVTRRVLPGLVGSALAMLGWLVSVLAMRQVLASPTRSGSDLELAWEDAERADTLRTLSNRAVTVVCASLLFWPLFIWEGLTTDGLYRTEPAFTWLVVLTTLGVYIALFTVVVAGPVSSSLSGRSRGHEQRRLWPDGIPT